MKIVCVGDVGYDHYLPLNKYLPGGISYNVAIYAKGQFAPDDVIQLVSVLGDDENATQLRSNLTQKGIEQHIETLPGLSPIQDVHLDKGICRFGNYEAGVLENYSVSESARRVIRNSDLLIVPWFDEITTLFESVMRTPSKGLRVVDFADISENKNIERITRWLPKFDIAFFGLLPSDEGFISEIANLAKTHNKLMIVTLAAHGSVAFDGRDRYQCVARPVPRVVDTTGAGDTFAAAFLAEYTRTKDIQRAMHNGAELAAQTVARLGTTPELATNLV